MLFVEQESNRITEIKCGELYIRFEEDRIIIPLKTINDFDKECYVDVLLIIDYNDITLQKSTVKFSTKAIRAYYNKIV